METLSGLFFVLWVLPSIVPGLIAASKGRSFMGFFLLSLFFSPVIGLIAALVASKSQSVTITNNVTSQQAVIPQAPVQRSVSYDAPRVTHSASTQALPINPSRTVETEVAMLERLHKLKQEGVLTEEEFKAEKHKLLHPDTSSVLDQRPVAAGHEDTHVLDLNRLTQFREEGLITDEEFAVESAKIKRS